MIKQQIDQILKENTEPTVGEWFQEACDIYARLDVSPVVNDFEDFQPLAMNFFNAVKQQFQGTPLAAVEMGWVDTTGDNLGTLRKFGLYECDAIVDEAIADYRLQLDLKKDCLQITVTAQLKYTPGVRFPIDVFWFDLYPSQRLSEIKEISKKEARLTNYEEGMRFSKNVSKIDLSKGDAKNIVRNNIDYHKMKARVRAPFL